MKVKGVLQQVSRATNLLQAQVARKSSLFEAWQAMVQIDYK